MSLRAMAPTDRNFVLSSWLRSYADQQRGMNRRAFFKLYESVVVNLVGRSSVLIAGLDDVPDAILGWAAIDADDRTLHYVFVKPRWRKLGIATTLLKDAACIDVLYTHEPPSWAKVPASWSFEPMARYR